jgi:PAS domain S-box-containing protein
MIREEIFAVALENFPDGIIIADQNDSIIFVNAAAEKIRHISRDEKMGRSILDCHQEQSREKVCRALSYIKEKQNVFRRMVVDTIADRVYENTYQVIADADKAVLGSMVVSKDITEKKKAEQENIKYNQKLQLEITGLTDRLNTLFLESLTSLVCTLEAKDIYTKGHSERVTKYSTRFVEEVYGSTQLLSDIGLAARLHDIGKIGIHEAILNKPGKLSEAETAIMRKHPLIMEQILSPFVNLKDVICIAKHHHERYDGTGYPDGLAGESINLGSRILALADTYDAITSTRPYRKALDVESAIHIIRENLGTQFDPEVGIRFVEMIETGTI